MDVNVIESRIQIFNCRVLRILFPELTALIKVSPLEILILLYEEILLVSQRLFLEIHYRFRLSMEQTCCAKCTVLIRVLKHKINVSLFIDLIALYLNP